MAQFIKQLYKLTVLETIHTEYCPLVTQQQVQNNCMWIGTRKMYMYLHNTLQIKFIETYLRIQYYDSESSYHTNNSTSSHCRNKCQCFLMRQFIKFVSLQFWKKHVIFKLKQNLDVFSQATHSFSFPLIVKQSPHNDILL